MSGLYKGLGSVRKKDNSSLRAGMFHDLIQSKVAYRVIYRIALIKFWGKPASLMFSFYALFRIFYARVKLNTVPGLVGVYQYDNERRCIHARSKRPIEEFITFEKSILRSNVLWESLRISLNLSSVLRTIRISQKLIKKHGILIGTRQTQVICVYSFFKKYFCQFEMSGSRILVSTESNPDVIGVALAARDNGAKTIYVNHSFLDSHLGWFFHDEFVVQGQALLDRIEANMMLKNKSNVKMVGAYFDTKPLKLPITKVKTIGLVCSLGPNVEAIENLITKIETAFPEARIEVRLHPNKLLSAYLIERLNSYGKVKIIPSQDWAMADYSHWDFAIASNTSAHIDLIGKGVPSIGYDFDNHPDDMYDFYRRGFIPKISEMMKVEEAINMFYCNDEWKNISFFYLPQAEKSLVL